MNNAFYQLQMPANEPVNTYAPGTAARASLKAELDRQAAQQVLSEQISASG